MAQYSDILTRDQLIRDADKSEALFDSAGSLTSDEETLIDEAIRDATSDVERYLDRYVVVHKVDQGFNAYDWRYDRKQHADKYWAWAEEWPIVEVSTSNVSIQSRNSRKLERDKQKTEVVTYFAGFRREGQTLSDLQNQWGNLSTKPSRLPGAIRRVGLVIALHYILRARSGDLGFDTITQTVGPQQVEVRTDRGFVDNQLSRLEGFRRAR